jgi:hypothetical protein
VRSSSRLQLTAQRSSGRFLPKASSKSDASQDAKVGATGANKDAAKRTWRDSWSISRLTEPIFRNQLLVPRRRVPNEGLVKARRLSRRKVGATGAN